MGGRRCSDGPAVPVRDEGQEPSGKWGQGAWAGKGEDSEAGQSQGKRVWDPAKAADPSPVRVPAPPPRLAPDYKFTKGSGEQDRVAPARGSPKNSTVVSRLKTTRSQRVRSHSGPAPGPRSQSRSPKEPWGGASAPAAPGFAAPEPMLGLRRLGTRLGYEHYIRYTCYRRGVAPGVRRNASSLLASLRVH